ncbi:trafficking protein Mon1-domain-containing protein [Amylostereum chailletii]|nr:trafficking protein Mon1-domain-containing protein [Amylostereum chailletii]
MSTAPKSGIESSASSVFNVDMNEGILVPEADADVSTVDGEAGSAMGRSSSPAGDESSKKALRDQLRKTLSKKESFSDASPRRARRRNRTVDADDLAVELANAFPPRQYFVLTDAGKPVFATGVGDHDSDNLGSIVGVMQALLSVFLDDGDKLRCINAGNTRINFLLRTPLYYACVSSWGEPESVTRTHLEYLHLQVLSVVTVTQLRRIFERRTNFDLGRLLSGAENLIHALMDRVEMDLAMNTSSLHCLKLDPTVRKRAANALLPTSKMKDLLYIILVAHGYVITLARPRKHSIHPSDLHILMNTAHSPSIVNSSASASWLPLCLPKFNSSGFVNTFVTFLQSPEEPQSVPNAPEAVSSDSTSQSEDHASTQSSPVETETSEQDIPKPLQPTTTAGVGLICVSGNGDFESIRSWSDTVTQTLTEEGTLTAILESIRTGTTEYSCSELAIPGLRHFIYKSRLHVQITAPIFEEPYGDLHERRRLITLYQILHDNIHAKSGQDLPLKLQYIRTEKEGVLGWITQPFELYVTLSPWIPKTAVVGAANAVARWVKKEEAHLFLRDAPVF